MQFERISRDIVKFGYYAGLCIMIVALAHSKYSMSVSQFILAGAFACYRLDYKRISDFFTKRSGFYAFLFILPFFLLRLLESMMKGFRVFWKNKPAVVLSSILLMHVVGLLFTTDFEYALKDLRTKLPLLLLPLFLSTMETFHRKSFYWILILFIAAVVIRTLINSWYLWEGAFIDFRDVSKPISHQIVALLVSFSVFILAFFILRRKAFPVFMKTIFFLLFSWLLVYLVLVKSATGVFITVLTFLVLLLVMALRKGNLKIRLVLGAVIILSLAGAFLGVRSVVRQYYRVDAVDFARMDTCTSRGNRYQNDINSRLAENGTLVWIYVQFDELRESWNARSRIPFDGPDRSGQRLMNTLVRYMASKGLRKDADGMSRLTDRDIQTIERGIPNHIYANRFSIRGRIFEFLTGYEKYRESGDPTGSTVMQRFEFWKASSGLIRGNWLTGVGTGDMNDAFRTEYERMHTKLAPGQRWRSHNQFLSVTVGFGIIGMVWFLLALVYPPIALRRFSDYFFLVFFIIAMLSMIPEDTIESQAGVTFVSFFYSFLLFSRKDPDPLP